MEDQRPKDKPDYIRWLVVNSGGISELSEYEEEILYAYRLGQESRIEAGHSVLGLKETYEQRIAELEGDLKAMDDESVGLLKRIAELEREVEKANEEADQAAWENQAIIDSGDLAPNPDQGYD